ncbi:hypothetical protein GA0061078_1397 [Bifidobacterium bohemicum]|uniref:Nif11 domain-containing protein n=1 Tax=Bifidobacterium bohemicum DSM 22767 TaxID=1437606 RepID=A0A086ZGT8_9BIFI|nr:hypothetical protein [Bifidobacterium bohemicum]KFI45738.1 hypothetical protein BBOH_0540 [Bifidobacterium bohemicum DSM 22767]SCC08318.1 hypothetical protein GA0061078_1397 [Bifidobacterium bohemicum]
MDVKALADKLRKVTTISEVIEVAKENGVDLNLEQADMMLSDLFQAESEAAELNGETVEQVVEKYFNK